MIAPPPLVRYQSRHHWLWTVRRLIPLLHYLGVWIAFMVLAVFSLVGSGDAAVQIPAMLLLLFLLGAAGGYLYYIYLDWRTRLLSVLSDGRFEYRFGILRPKGITIPMRFGAVRFDYRDRLGYWLDCADLILPYGEGVIEAIPNFKHFWRIAQGRE